MFKIAIQGVAGSFSEAAANSYAKQQGINNFEPCYLISSEKVLMALENADCDLGIFAIENSTGGVVLESIYALAKYRCTIKDFFSIPVEQSLIAKPGITIDMVTEIYSHQQALRQCKIYLKTQFNNVKIIATQDTALSAVELHNNQLPHTAAVICNKICADLYNLHLLAVGINDLKDNQTQFIAATPFNGDLCTQ